MRSAPIPARRRPASFLPHHEGERGCKPEQRVANDQMKKGEQGKPTEQRRQRIKIRLVGRPESRCGEPDEAQDRNQSALSEQVEERIVSLKIRGGIQLWMFQVFGLILCPAGRHEDGRYFEMRTRTQAHHPSLTTPPNSLPPSVQPHRP